MSSSWLVAIGVIGLVGCLAVRVAPFVKKWWPVRLRSKVSGLHAIVEAYEVLHSALVENGETEEADYLRMQSLPSALKPVSDEP